MKEQLYKLKTILREEKDFSATFNKFFDIYEEQPEQFLRASEKIDVPLIKNFLTLVVAQIFDKKAKISKSLMLEIKEYGFIHGSYFLSPPYHVKTAGTFFFFRGERMGLAHLQIGNSAHYFRISMDLCNEEGELVDKDPFELDPEDME